jgi:hypothetical protein
VAALNPAMATSDKRFVPVALPRETERRKG